MTEPPPIFPDPAAAGREMRDWMAGLFPLCRSLTGPGVRETLRMISEQAPLEIREVPTGAPMLDWESPKEWTIRKAWIRGPDGRTVVDFRDSNLHVVGYSVPVNRKMTLAELQPHLHSLPEHPDWIPYRTNYYGETWGFCLAHRVREALPDGLYEVRIDSDLAPGALVYGERVLRGQTGDEVLISAHICHPSLANDNLSGIAVAVWAARWLTQSPRRHTYRFLFAPGTVGSIAWLAQHEEAVPRIRHGLVLACLGDRGGFTYKRTRGGDGAVDRAAARVLNACAPAARLLDFSPYGYDERQFNAPGFQLSVGCLMRSMYGTFPEYHTSADNMDFVSADALGESLAVVLRICDALDREWRPVNQYPKGEPQLGRRGLYAWLGGRNDKSRSQMALLWVLNLSDGQHSLPDMSERSGLPLPMIQDAADALARHGLISP